MRILGKILILVPLLLGAAKLNVYVKKNPITLGEPAKLVIEASGDDIELPKIQRIAGYPVAGRSLMESVVNQNGSLVVKKVLELTFYPDRNVTIDPITVVIDGKEYKSQPIKLGLIKRIKRDDYVTFYLKPNKKEAYVGEPIILDMVLKIRRGLNIVNYDFIPPRFDGFWVKEIKSTNKHLEEHGEYLIKRIKFLLLPQKPGVLTITSALFKYAVPKSSTDIFGFSITAPEWKSVASNPVQIVAKPLPKDVELVGDFRMRVEVDKNVTKANEPVNLTFVIEGEGNLESFSGLKLDIPDATIYTDEPKSSIQLKNGRLFGSVRQHFSIIADHDFVIPAIDIDYFSLKDRQIRTLHSDPVPIKVMGGQPKPSVIQSDSKVKGQVRESGVAAGSGACTWEWRSFFTGVVTGILIVAILGVGWFLRRRGRIKISLSSKKALLTQLLPYVGESKEAASMAQALYEEIYEGRRSKVSKKEVKRLLEDLMQRRRPLHPGV